MDKSFMLHLGGINEDFIDVNLQKEIKDLIRGIPDFIGSVSIEDPTETWEYFAKLKEKNFKLEAEICDLMGENAEMRRVIDSELGDGYC